MRRGTRTLWAAEHDGKHICACGCGGVIQIKPEHFNLGIPSYLLGHNTSVPRKPRRDPLPCACGCGNLATTGRRFISGHNARGSKRSDETRAKLSEGKLGSRNPQFGKEPHNFRGRVRAGDGYWAVFAPSHPFAQPTKGYVMEHRRVIEEHLRATDPESPFLIEVYGRLYLRPEFHVHHIDGDKTHNVVENLMVVTPEEHAVLHKEELRAARWPQSPSP